MSSNLPEVEAALKNYVERFYRQIAAASEEIAYQLEGDGKREIKGVRPKGEKAVSGHPPMNRTGNLRRSIRGQSIRKGFGVYSAVVGADIVYARAVEVGNPYNPPSWTHGEHFPFLAPALQKFVASGKIQRIITKHIRSL